MDISKIVDKAIDKTVHDITDENFKSAFTIDDEKISKLSKQDRILMHYSEILLETYHEELLEALSKHGINL